MAEWIKTIVLALAIALLVRFFIMEPRAVLGSSMESTLRSGEKVIVYKLGYRFHQPKRGDIVVFTSEAETEGWIIKRVIGLPGEVVEIRGGYVFVDGVQLEEPYLDSVTRGPFGPFEVPSSHIFVLGDNRGDSLDSRYSIIGPVPLSKVMGQAVAVYWPPADIRILDSRPTRAD